MGLGDGRHRCRDDQRELYIQGLAAGGGKGLDLESEDPTPLSQHIASTSLNEHPLPGARRGVLSTGAKS